VGVPSTGALVIGSFDGPDDGEMDGDFVRIADGSPDSI
jgi:hypothetical protein